MQSYKIFSNRQYPRLLKMLGYMIRGIMGSNPLFQNNDDMTAIVYIDPITPKLFTSK